MQIKRYEVRNLQEAMANIKKELGPDTRVIATGGFAETIAKETHAISILAPWLTLDGLRIIYELNV